MSGYGPAMRVFEAMCSGAEGRIVRPLMDDLIGGDGRVRFSAILPFHEQVCRIHRFVLGQNTTEFVLPGGRHLFYINGHLLLRVKTSGTRIRPTPHLTVSLAVGMGWNDEVAKISRLGEVVPKLGGVPRADWRSLTRLGNTTEEIAASDDRWASACHFDFPQPFDMTGQESLCVQ